MRVTLSLDNLRCFTEAARLLNFRTAARSVALSPAALGQRIRQLEDTLGGPLFHRTTRVVVLTDRGLALLPLAEQTLAAAENCRRAGSTQSKPVPFDLVLGTRHELGLSWIVPMTDKLEGEVPGLSLHYYFGSGNDLLQRVRSVEIDCAVTSSRVIDPKLAFLPLHEERYAFVAAPKLVSAHPLRTARDAAAHTLIDATDELPLFRYLRDARGGLDSLDFARVVRMGTIAAIRLSVLRGKGVAVLPEYFVGGDVAAGRLVRVLPKIAPLADRFRLVFRGDDPRRTTFDRLASRMLKEPLR